MKREKVNMNGNNEKSNFIYTMFREGSTFSLKAILPCGPLLKVTQIHKTISMHYLQYIHIEAEINIP